MGKNSSAADFRNKSDWLRGLQTINAWKRVGKLQMGTTKLHNPTLFSYHEPERSSARYLRQLCIWSQSYGYFY